VHLTAGAAGHAQDLPAALIDRLDANDPKGAEALVLEHLDATGQEVIGTRSTAEIAERLLAQAADMRETPLPRDTAALIERYIAVRAPAHEAAAQLRELVRGHGLDLSAGLDAFQRRLDLLAKSGIDVDAIEFSAEFGRNLEYYTGFVFEVLSPGLGPKSPVAGGGRYDSLLADAGAPASVPAVGASVHTERLFAVLEGAAP